MTQQDTKPKVEFTEEQQAEVNRIVTERLAREREKWDQEHQAELEAKDGEIAELQEAAETRSSQISGKLAEREARMVLATKGIQEGRRVDLILRNADLSKVPAGDDGLPDSKGIRKALREVSTAAPELFGQNFSWDGSVDGAAHTTERRYTRDQLSQMSPDEINANWSDVQASLS